MPLKLTIDRFIDDFVPAEIAEDRERRTRARMFLFSHFCGPFVGSAIPFWLFFLDGSRSEVLLVIAASILSFWAYPFALKKTGRYEALSYISIQNLLFVILYGCYYFGGMSSPFLPWLVVVPLLAFFYLGSTVTSISAIFAQVALNGIAFVAAYRWFGEDTRVPIEALQALGIISIVTAALYVSMLATFYVRISDSQAELEIEVDHHLVTAKELRAAAAEAERAGAAKGDFLARMSHELRTPLNAVIGYSQMLIEDAVETGEQEVVEDLDRIRNAGRRLLGIINAVLDLSKIEAGKMSLQTQPCCLVDLLSSCVSRQAALKSDAGNIVRLDAEADLPDVAVDSSKIAQIIDILLANADAYTKKGDIVVVCRRKLETLELSVSDTGRGIEAERLPTLFDDILHRNDQHASLCAGAGLGLPLANQLCKLLGATLEIASTAGVGTKVSIRLPFPYAVSQALPLAVAA